MKTASRTWTSTPRCCGPSKESAAPLAVKLDLHTVGDLLRHYRRYVARVR